MTEMAFTFWELWNATDLGLTMVKLLFCFIIFNHISTTIYHAMLIPDQPILY